ncbi:NUDIX domain-containing protein [Actinoplanes sp. NPDC049548]|uniref:NUDIX domain-containing protein n=1 Tax=Actinoplanes sp. NPDC049548 TaxID=3155152 RepID=UPI003432DB75
MKDDAVVLGELVDLYAGKMRQPSAVRTFMSEGHATIPPMIRIVVGALVREGHILLVHRGPNRPVYPNVWDLAGGHVETGETELAALARELHEELDVRIRRDSAIHLCRLQVGRGEESVHFSAWIVEDWEGTPSNTAPEEHDEIRWFRPEKLPPLTHDPVRKALLDAMRGARA